ncbi:MAG: serine/threonine protein kinase [Bacillota bacterium]
MFCVFAENDSGNISFGLNDGKERRFVKVAGLETIEFKGNPKDAVRSLERAMPLYTDLKHPNLIELTDHYRHDDMYVAVFRWSDGDCLFDHWNFEKYSKNPAITPPYDKFKQLPLVKRLRAFDVVLSFFETVAQKKYVAIDFYDGSIMYDFETDRTTICDIDFFEKQPYTNTMGRMWGSSRFMSPEEFTMGANIDEVTNVYTLGASAFLALGDESDRGFEKWQAGRDLFDIATKATDPDRSKRYQSISEFAECWRRGVARGC